MTKEVELILQTSTNYPNMITLYHKISPKNQAAIRSDLQDNCSGFLRTDMGKVARGRKRFWLKYVWNFRYKKLFQGVSHPRLEEYLSAIDIEYDLGVVSYADKGTTWHRDGTFCDYTAYTINLSIKPVEFGYQACYPKCGYSEQNLEAPKEMRLLMPGEIIKYNAKNPHITVNNDPNRWSITLWKLKPSLRDSVTSFSLTGDEFDEVRDESAGVLF